MKSLISLGNRVPFSEFTGERIYLEPIEELKGRWAETIEAMLNGMTVDRAYLTVEQSFVLAGYRQRRNGVHIDCPVVEELRAHGAPPRHLPAPPPQHSPRPPTHSYSAADSDGGIILASDFVGCRAWVGEFGAQPRLGGDCSHVNTNAMEELTLQPYQSYIGNRFMLHETLPALQNHFRTFVRISFDVTPQIA